MYVSIYDLTMLDSLEVRYYYYKNKSSKLSIRCNIGQKLNFEHKQVVVIELLVNNNIPGIFVRSLNEKADNKEICEVSYFYNYQGVCSITLSHKIAKFLKIAHKEVLKGIIMRNGLFIYKI
ncbi:hypothetical protein LCGC14_1579800 [marine sediment metagenome]|uniref:Uncharacterized protein n=1 Tax=marine sediment metagenome TaxID=412755 RepID=A0A0F9IH69_9ZZZZ